MKIGEHKATKSSWAKVQTRAIKEEITWVLLASRPEPCTSYRQTHRQTDRQRQRHGQTETDKDRQTDRDRQRQTETEIWADRDMGRQRHGETATEVAPCILYFSIQPCNFHFFHLQKYLFEGAHLVACSSSEHVGHKHHESACVAPSYLLRHY